MPTRLHMAPDYDADVDDNEDYDEGFEDEDYDNWLLCLINWHLSDQALDIEYIK